MIQKSDLSEKDLNAFIDAVSKTTQIDLSQLPLDTLLQSMDFLPENLAPTGGVLKYTLYDFIGKSCKQDDKRTGVCAGFLFALKDGATINPHEHKDTGSPTDTIEVYKPLTPEMTDHLGNPLTTTPCLLGETHGIGPMGYGGLVQTLKSDRDHTINIGVPSPYPKRETNKDLDR